MISLADIPAGYQARIRHLHGTSDSRKRLREMGLFENAIVQCIHNRKGVVICGILQSRIGLPRDIARGIFVTRVDGSKEQ